MPLSVFYLNAFDAHNISRPNVTKGSNYCIPRYNGDPVYASTSFLSIFFNVLVILVLSDMLRKKITTAKIHLLALTISDISVNIVMILGAMLQWFYDKCFGNCDAKFRGLFDPRCTRFQDLFIYSNMGMTIYITYVRACAFSLSYGDKSVKTLSWELFLYGAVASGLLPLFASTSVYQITGRSSMWDPCGMFYLMLIVFAMIAMTAYIVVKLHNQRTSDTSVSLTSRPEVKEFQLMVIVTLITRACIFFVLLSITVVLMVGKEDLKGVLDPIIFCVAIAFFIKNGISYFIYMLVSCSFRKAFVWKCQQIACMTHSQ